MVRINPDGQVIGERIPTPDIGSYFQVGLTLRDPLIDGPEVKHMFLNDQGVVGQIVDGQFNPFGAGLELIQLAIFLPNGEIAWFHGDPPAGEAVDAMAAADAAPPPPDVSGNHHDSDSYYGPSWK